MRMRGLISVLVVCCAFGCGGGHSADSGRAIFTVNWPPSRLIPAAAQSIRVEIRRNNAAVASQVIPRPAGGGPASITFQNLPVGAVTAIATAHPQTDGTGVAQAQGSVGFTVQAGQTVPFTLTMTSTIDHIELLPNDITLNQGQFRQLGVTAKNAANELVLISAGKLDWSSIDTNVATVDSNGRVTAQRSGSTQIRVTETESGKSATANVEVRPAGFTDDFNDNSTDLSFWEIVADGFGPTVAEVNQQLEVTVPASSTGFFFGYRSRCVLRGDFDYQVEYKLITWPSTNGVRAGLWFGNIPTRHWSNVHRVSLAPFEFGTDPRESETGTYFTSFGQNDAYVRSATAATTGKLRLKRVNGVFTNYYWDSATSQWRELISGGNVAADGSIGILVWSDNTAFQDKDVKVAFDNFALTQGQSICP